MRNSKDLRKSRNVQIFFWKETYIRELLTHCQLQKSRGVSVAIISGIWKRKWRKFWYKGLNDD